MPNWHDPPAASLLGTAWIDDIKPWRSKGPSGVAVRTIIEWVRSYADDQR